MSWGAIGARTTESQIHRQLASGLSMPVGFKNSTDGDVQVAVDAIRAAASGQVFIGITDDGRPAILTTTGNPDCHVVLRGSASGPELRHRQRGPMLSSSLLGPDCPAGSSSMPATATAPRITVGNSRSSHHLATRIGGGEPGIVGVMLESFLEPGRQEMRLGATSELTYGQSVTDACIGWDDTVAALHGLATAISDRRTRPECMKSTA